MKLPTWTSPCGRVQLYQADALDVLPELPEQSIDLIATDPPYSSGGMFRGDRASQNTRTKYQQTGTEKRYAEFDGDNRDQRGFAAWARLWLADALRLAKTGGGVAAIFADWRQLPTVTDVLQIAGWVWRGIVPWDKTEGSRPHKGRFRSQCEYVAWASRGGMPQEGPVLPGCFRMPVERDKPHITAKPIELMGAITRIAWREDAVILDPFMGGGSTGCAAIRAGRRFIGCEIQPAIFADARRRLEVELARPTLFAG